MNIKLYFNLMLIGSCINIQHIQTAGIPNKPQTQIPPIFGAAQTTPQASIAPATGTTPINTIAPIVAANPPISTMPNPVIANPPAQKNLPTDQSEQAITKQIKDGKNPTQINTFGLPRLSLYNNTMTSVFVGFEGSIALSEIPGTNRSSENRIQVPAGKSYLIYAENNPTATKALHISYQSDANTRSEQPNILRTCSVKNGAPSFDKNISTQTFTGSAYICTDPDNQKDIIILGKLN